MTSRRAFLGLLAAAPVVAPAMAKAAAEEVHLVNGSTMRFVGTVGCSNPVTLLSAIDMEWDEAVIRAPKLSVDTLECDHLHDALFGPSHRSCFDEHYSQGICVPNRLFGVTINEHGEAV